MVVNIVWKLQFLWYVLLHIPTVSVTKAMLTMIHPCRYNHQIASTTTTTSISMTMNHPENPLIIPPPPAISMPVWSLACSTHAVVSSQLSIDHPAATTTLPSTSMNIVTFCTAVSVAAPKLYIISLYYHTLTKDAFLTSGSGILQLLRPDHKHLVPILGKYSGYDPNYKKQSECKKMGYPWVSSLTPVYNTEPDQSTEETSSTLDVLPNCATYIHVKIVQSNDYSTTVPAGDHLVVLCEVLGTFQWNATTNTISTVTSSNANTTHYIPSFDATTVLYTGQLRQEGII